MNDNTRIFFEQQAKLLEKYNYRPHTVAQVATMMGFNNEDFEMLDMIGAVAREDWFLLSKSFVSKFLRRGGKRKHKYPAKMSRINHIILRGKGGRDYKVGPIEDGIRTYYVNIEHLKFVGVMSRNERTYRSAVKIDQLHYEHKYLGWALRSFEMDEKLRKFDSISQTINNMPVSTATEIVECLIKIKEAKQVLIS